MTQDNIFASNDKVHLFSYDSFLRILARSRRTPIDYVDRNLEVETISLTCSLDELGHKEIIVEKKLKQISDQYLAVVNLGLEFFPSHKYDARIDQMLILGVGIKEAGVSNSDKPIEGSNILDDIPNIHRLDYDLFVRKVAAKKNLRGDDFTTESFGMHCPYSPGIMRHDLVINKALVELAKGYDSITDFNISFCASRMQKDATIDQMLVVGTGVRKIQRADPDEGKRGPYR